MSERHLPKKANERLKIYRQLTKTPAEPPCDVCPWRLHPDKVQGCDNAGCGYMYLYLAVKRYQKEEGHSIHLTNEAQDKSGIKP